MTGEEAIKWLKNLKKDIGHPRHGALWHYEQALDEIIQALTQEPKTSEWIPCSERLPEEFYVMCCDTRGEILIANPFECAVSDTGFSAESNECYMYNCIAWMPLPMPYREDDEA